MPGGCAHFTDPAGDANENPAVIGLPLPVASVPNGDVLVTRVVGSAGGITATVRLTSLTGPDGASPTGYFYSVTVSLPERSALALEATDLVDGQQFMVSTANPGVNTTPTETPGVSGTFDRASSTLTITARWEAVRAALGSDARNAAVSNVRTFTNRYIGSKGLNGGVTPTLDRAFLQSDFRLSPSGC